MFHKLEYIVLSYFGLQESIISKTSWGRTEASSDKLGQAGFEFLGLSSLSDCLHF